MSRTVLVLEIAFLGLVAFDHQRGAEAGLDVGELGCQGVGLAADLGRCRRHPPAPLISRRRARIELPRICSFCDAVIFSSLQ